MQSAGESMDGEERRSAQSALEDRRTQKAQHLASSESKWNRYQDGQLSSWVDR